MARAKASSAKPKKGSCIRNTLEVLFFFIWLLCTGLAGYIFGRTPIKIFNKADCPSTTPPEIIKATPHCEDEANISPAVVAVSPGEFEYIVVAQHSLKYNNRKWLYV